MDIASSWGSSAVSGAREMGGAVGSEDKHIRAWETMSRSPAFDCQLRCEADEGSRWLCITTAPCLRTASPEG